MIVARIESTTQILACAFAASVFLGCVFPHSTRQPYTIPEGELDHTFFRDIVHSGSGFSGRLRVDITFTHDHVLQSDVQNALYQLGKKYGHTLARGDLANVEESIAARFQSGSVGSISVSVLKLEGLPPPDTIVFFDEQ